MSVGDKIRQAADALGRAAEKVADTRRKQALAQSFGDPATRAASGVKLRATVAPFQARLSPATWDRVMAGVATAETTGEVDELEAALQVADAEAKPG
ncbi:MAG: hypothetical protein U1F43_05160 [Myxococcota bacterium]